MIPILYDKTGEKQIGFLSDAIKCEVLEERNGEFELTLIYPSNSMLLSGLEKENIIISDANDYLKKQQFRIYMTRKLMSNRIEVSARHISFDLAHDWIDNISINNQSCEYVLNTLFRNSQFSSHYRGYSNIVMTANYTMSKANIIEAIGGKSGSIIDTFGNGAEILRDNTEISVLHSRGHDNEVSIEYRKNLTGLTVEEDTTNLVTRIRPYAIVTDPTGCETEIIGDFVDSPLIGNYAHPYVKYIDYSEKFDEENLPTEEKLRTLALREYSVNKIDIPKMNYKIEFVPLSKCVGYEGLEDRINLCDIITIRDTRYGIDTQAKVIKVTYNVLRDRYDKMELGEPKTTLGDVIGGSNTAIQGPPGPQGPQGPAGADGSIGDFPNTLPPNPVITATLYGFASIELTWTFENKVYYSYELYASKIQGFVPNTFNLLFSGQASTFLHQVKPTETWYYRVCAINSHGQRTEFSPECEVKTIKINDLSDYVESASIGDALIGTLSLDRGWVGQLHGNWIDARQLSVTDGNGKRTLDIDSFGKVNLDVASLKINSKDVISKEQTETLIEEKAGEINLEVSSTYETKSEATSKYDTATAIAKAMADGKVLYTDITFRSGNNNVAVYNNTGNGNVVIDHIARPYDCPTTSAHCLRITHKGVGSPNLGGFVQWFLSRANAVFIQKFVAKLPIGYTLNTASNAMGAGATDKWLTDNKGTGEWETYIRQVNCGSTGTFSTGGYVHVSGATPTASAPLVWYLASCTAIDITDSDERIADLTTRMSSAEQKITDSAITNTVKNNFYTKNETNDLITSKGYATTSQLQQTSDAYNAKFTSSGGYNLLKNGKASLDTSYWDSNGGGIARVGDSVYGSCFKTEMPSGMRYAGGNPSTPHAIRLKQRTHYVFQAMVYSRTTQTGHGVTPLHFWCSTSHTTAGSAQCSILDYNQKTVAGTWIKCYVHFLTASSGEVWFSPFIYGLGSGTIWVTEIALIESQVPLPYSPHPNEVYDGVTNITKDGIRVSQSNVGTYTHMSANGFYVRMNNGVPLFEATNKVVLYDNKGVSCVQIVNDHGQAYGNSRIDIRGGINFIHNSGQSTGTNQILLGNHDVNNQYGMHNLFIRCWNTLGFADNNNWTNMFADIRRGRWILKGAVYQNAQTPPRMFSMNFDEDDEIYRSGFTRSQAVDSIMHLKTGVYVDNDGECCSAIYGGHDELITTEYTDEDGITSTHINTSALNASLVVTCQEQQKLIEALQNELNEIKKYLKIA